MKASVNPLQFGNHKLPKSSGIFNLPRLITCPGRTAYCEKHCYAGKAERMYKQVLPYRLRQLELTKDPVFVSFVEQYVRAQSTGPRKLSVIRVHESGDFYCQEYLNKWLQIARNLPSVIFYAYTKSFKLNFKKRPKNFIIRGSVDPSSSKVQLLAAGRLDGTAETIEHGQQPRRAAAFLCPGSCKTCDYCLTPGDVMFYRH